MSYGVQFRGTLGPSETQRWFTFGWPAGQDYAWVIVPTDVQSGNPHVDWDVAIERASDQSITYWLTIRNLTSDTFNFEARYNYIG